MLLVITQGIKKYMSDPAAALTDSAAHLKEAIKGTPVEALAKQAAEATQQDEVRCLLISTLSFGSRPLTFCSRLALFLSVLAHVCSLSRVVLVG